MCIRDRLDSVHTDLSQMACRLHDHFRRLAGKSQNHVRNEMCIRDRAITIPVQEDFMCVTSFEGGTASTGKLTFRKDIDHDIEGRDVLILEDIIDSGSTLKLIVELFQARKPASIKICTLLDKPSGRKVDLEPDYTCFCLLYTSRCV